ncbi:UNVERIFIED_CONTAM: hypothetical protein PYX00_008803 [Menopon gallinae]|uniref:BZIP domain-containing protein n=1 Tax=Menopon gallinae TaxID=328185 RepID=A0AAW2HQS7_9NEOP
MAKKEELERYQDCSWFQSKSTKEDCISKLSQAEILNSPDTEVNVLDLDIPFADRSIPVPVWGDEYLEVYDEADLRCEMDDKFEGKESYIYPPNENIIYNNSKLGEDGFSDINNYIDYSIRKTDSYDNMKVITSTSLAEIIPISYQEQVNNANYNIQSFEKVKCEIKEELEVGSPDCGSYAVESDDCDLIVGREEVIEVECQESGEKQIKTTSREVNCLEMESQGPEKKLVKADLQELKFKSAISNVIANEIPVEKLKSKLVPQKEGKRELRLNLSKSSFECQPLNVSTPDVCFMDLVNYINNETIPSSTITSPTVLFPQIHNVMPLKESSPNNGTSLKNETITSDEKSAVSTENTINSPPVTFKSENQSVIDLNIVSTEDISDTMSIAERIKVGSSRKRCNRYAVENMQLSEDDDDYEEPKRMRKHSKSSSLDSDTKLGTDSYRVRRDRNNEASKRSRQNKKLKEEQMCKSLLAMEEEYKWLSTEAAKLENMVKRMRGFVLYVEQERKKLESEITY